MPEQEEEEDKLHNKFKVTVTNGTQSREFFFEGPSRRFAAHMNVMITQMSQVIDRLVPEAGVGFPYRRILLSSVVNDNDFLLVADATAGALQVDLPLALSGGRLLAFQKSDSTANTVTISSVGVDTIEGGTEIVLTAQYQKALLLSDGVNGWIRLV